MHPILHAAFAGWVLATSLSGQSLESAPTPRFAGVYRPGIGFLSYQPESPSTHPQDAPQTTEPLQWQPLVANTETEHHVWQKGSGQVNGFALTYTSTQADSTGNGGNFLLRFWLPQGGYREIPLSGMPLGGARGQKQSWKVVVDLSNGLEPQVPFQNDWEFGWSWQADANQTGPCLKTQDGVTDVCLILLTQAHGFRSFYPSVVGTDDRLTLQAQEIKNRMYSFTVKGLHTDKRYALFLGDQKSEWEIGESTLLLDTDTIRERLLFENGECTLSVSLENQQPIFIQALEFDGVISKASLTGASQGLVFIPPGFRD